MGIRIPLRYETHGIDVSHHQGKIDWETVKNFRFDDNLKIAFAYLKATEGFSRQDKQFARNWKECKRLNIRRGAYHFYIPSRDPVAQADNFVKTVGNSMGDLPPVLDFEQDNGQSREQIIRDLNIWLNLIEKKYGTKPLIYTSYHYYKTYLKGNFDEYKLWIADYDDRQLLGYGSGEVVIWQHSRSATVRGIRGKVDFNAAFFE